VVSAEPFARVEIVGLTLLPTAPVDGKSGISEKYVSLSVEGMCWSNGVDMDIIEGFCSSKFSGKFFLENFFEDCCEEIV
jgi:hypothetical protein